MCGIAGFLDLSLKRSNIELSCIVSGMANALRQRGPDNLGVWVDAEAGIALGHRRLSIIDLTEAGHQPMHSACGRYVVVYNGEIYNFMALKSELQVKGHIFHGHSDTEVLLAAIIEWGVEGAVRRFNGMFAFALWDRTDKRLWLVRDRIGEKPLYYGWVGKTFIFGSELKTFYENPDFTAEIDRNTLALYLRFCYVPAPYSIYCGIYKLLPSAILNINASKAEATPVPTSYWSFKDTAEYGSSNVFTDSADEIINRLDSLLRDAVRIRMVADVPLGAFLSGGVDSSTIVALMQTQSAWPVKTFTIGFDKDSYNEAISAKAVAGHLGTDHTELYITAEDVMSVIPEMPSLYDEPYSDSSQIPTYLVSRLARRHVTVCLSGDGGDELFGGYNRYFWGRSIWFKLRGIPPWTKGIAAMMMTALSPQIWDFLFEKMRLLLPTVFKQRNPGDKLHKLSEALSAQSPAEMYIKLVSLWKKPSDLVIGAVEPVTALGSLTDLSDFTQWMMFMDTLSYLPDDILVKLDRASMGVGLEARVPFLDHRIIEFAWRMPLSMKIHNGQGKWLLRRLLYKKYVPKELIDSPKCGFGVPIGIWLRGPLRQWAESMLEVSRLKNEGFFNPEPIKRKWEEHLSGKRNWQNYLWNVLMFQAWKEQWN